MKQFIFSSLILLFFMSTAVFADTPEHKVADEAVSCASYYQISSHALDEMNVPQMKSIAEKLKLAEKQAVKLALKYNPNAKNDLIMVKKQQMNAMKNSTGLKNMISKYRSKCMALLSDPQKRLEYWQMILM